MHDKMFGIDQDPIKALSLVDQISLPTIRCSLDHINRFGAVDKYLRIYNFYQDPEIPGFFREAATLAGCLESYVNMPTNFREEGHRKNLRILHALIAGAYGFTLWDFFDDMQIHSLREYMIWADNPDYSIPENEAAPKKPRTGNVYLMRNNQNGYHKIGFTSGDPELREATLQSQEPDVELIWSVWKDMAFEKYLHEIFAEKRLRGEWFDLDDNDLQEIFEMESDNE